MMSVLSVRLLESFRKMARGVAGEDNVSLNQFISATAVAEKVAALTSEKYLAARAQRGSKTIFD